MDLDAVGSDMDAAEESKVSLNTLTATHRPEVARHSKG